MSSISTLTTNDFRKINVAEKTELSDTIQLHLFMHRLGRRAAYPYKACSGLCHSRCCIRYNAFLGQSFTTSCMRLDEPDSKGQPKKRWYNQLWKGALKREPVDAEDEDAGEGVKMAKMLGKKLAELNAQIAELQDERTMIEPLLQQFSKDDQNKVRAALREANLAESDSPPSEEAVRMVESEMMKILPKERMESFMLGRQSSMLSEIETQLELTPTQQRRIRRLNYQLRAATLNKSGAETKKTLWQSFARCKDHLPSFMQLLPDEAWNILWASQDDVFTDSQERATHLSILAKDMANSGKQLNLRQRIVLITSLSLEGRDKEAMHNWQSQQGLITKNGELPIEYETLGVGLYASQGDPARAQQTALNILSKGAQDMSYLLVPVMDAWVRSDDENGTRNAWALYLLLRSRMGSEITSEDYDKIIVSFLHADQKDLALAVFKDMMLTGEQTKYESTELYKTSLGIVSKLHLDSATPLELTKASLTALTVLPRRFQNKFFYGSWMKRLIGMGCPDEAAMVVDLMYERGVKPDSKHLNGILGAWLRSGNLKDQKKAEVMGWAMIQVRLDQVRTRPPRTTATSVAIPDAPDIEIPRRINRTVSPATIETFSLLLLHYERRGRLKYVQLLRDFLSPAQIKPNAYFMNHLLYAELRRGEHRKSWEMFKSMSPRVQPDLETFACLWDCEKAHLNKLSVYTSDKFPGPRRILFEMMTWYSTLGATSRDDVRQSFSKELYDQIIRCFGLSRDLEGTIVALYALKEKFQGIPDHATARMVTLQVASMGIYAPKNPGRRRSRLSDNIHSAANIGRITRVLELVTEHRADALKDRGITIGFDDPAAPEEQLYVLAEFLRVVLRRSAPEESAVEKDVERAAWEMGVGGMRIQEPNLAASTEGA